jgi:hypothetical protein
MTYELLFALGENPDDQRARIARLRAGLSPQDWREVKAEEMAYMQGKAADGKQTIRLHLNIAIRELEQMPWLDGAEQMAEDLRDIRKRLKGLEVKRNEGKKGTV